jgi:tetratricopeptide (TPR) repeat protein
VKALVNYSALLRNIGRYKEARKHLAHATRIAPDFAEADFVLASVELAAKRGDAAKGALLSALEKNPTLVPALNMMGRILFNEGNLMQAELYFRRALKADNTNVEALMGAFALHLKRGNLTAARKVRGALLKLVPESKEFQQLDGILRKIEKKREKPTGTVVM